MSQMHVLNVVNFIKMVLNSGSKKYIFAIWILNKL